MTSYRDLIDMASEEDVSHRYGDPSSPPAVRYLPEVNEEVARDAFRYLWELAQEAADPECDPDNWTINSETWMEGATAGDWSIVLYDDEGLTVEWITGPHSWAYIDADRVISAEDEARIITRWNERDGS